MTHYWGLCSALPSSFPRPTDSNGELNSGRAEHDTFQVENFAVLNLLLMSISGSTQNEDISSQKEW